MVSAILALLHICTFSVIQRRAAAPKGYFHLSILLSEPCKASLKSFLAFLALLLGLLGIPEALIGCIINNGN